ncbi:MAG TPA: glycoside hydrolase family 2 TIM barrel-domain containing protein [Pirellulales bacterium]|nr:glycoside hydrolase family 2 TIM barrel-domain containing protein [Pirellulales bacterium]
MHRFQRHAGFVLLAAGWASAVICGYTVARAAENAADHKGWREVDLFDADWRFYKGDAKGAEAPDFDDANWRKLDVPHDWSIEGPFDKDNPTGGAGAFLPAGVGWYRKHFTLPAADKGHRVFIEFDGVMANSEVWINGHSLGKRPFGYVSFRYDLTDHLNFGDKPNVLAVRCDNSQQPASRWYAGAGIYRHVHLETVNPVHLDLWPQYVTTPKISADEATIHVHSTVTNQSDRPGEFVVETNLLDPEGKPAGPKMAGEINYPVKKISPGETAEFDQDLTVPKPQLWDLDHPNLYSAVAKLFATDNRETPIDSSTALFGIREAKFDAATGFSLNGKNMKLLGVCLHHDGGALGAAVPLSVWQRRLEALKQIGVNAIRTSHNPPAPEFLDLCDRMGFLVMDEMFDCWTAGKNKFDYHLYFNDWWKTDTTDTLLRDRDHPCIVIYSAGNEIGDINANNDKGSRVFVPIRDVMHQLDPTRPVTVAVLQPNQHGVYVKGGFAELMDVVGQNYRENELVAYHQANPQTKIIGTENHHDMGEWIYLRDNPAYSGQFLWTGFDYLGESKAWPKIGYNWGLFDRIGTPNGIGYQRQSWWSDVPMVHLVRREPPQRTADRPNNAERLPRFYSDWSPHVAADEHGENVQTVEAFSNCDTVELLLNDKSLGVKPRPADNASPREWKVPFEPGTLRAIASNDGKVVATHELRTAGKPAKIALETDRKELADDWDDVAFVGATVVDENGTPVPDATEPIKFGISGPGAVVAVDAGDPTSTAPFQTVECRPFHGLCAAIVRSTAPKGEITLTATSADLPAATVTMAAAAAK